MDENGRLLAALSGENPLGLWVARIAHLTGGGSKELADVAGVPQNYLSMLGQNGPSYAKGTAQALIRQLCVRLGFNDDATTLTLQAGLVLAQIGGAKDAVERARIAGVLVPSITPAVLKRAQQMLCEAHFTGVPHDGGPPRPRRNRRSLTTGLVPVIRRAHLIEARNHAWEIFSREDDPSLFDAGVRACRDGDDCKGAMAQILSTLRREDAELEARQEEMASE